MTAHERHLERMRLLLELARNEALRAIDEARIADAETGRDREIGGGSYIEDDEMQPALNFVDWHHDEIGKERS